MRSKHTRRRRSSGAVRPNAIERAPAVTPRELLLSAAFGVLASAKIKTAGGALAASVALQVTFRLLEKAAPAWFPDAHGAPLEQRAVGVASFLGGWGAGRLLQHPTAQVNL